jgi:GNAT superfamily N-acetyltransferase
MENTYQIILESEPNSNDINALVKGLTEFNASKTDGATYKYLFATVRDSEGTLAGGLLGATYLGWLQVQVVWLEDSLRGHGYGRALMELAEEEAVGRGCTRVFLETFSFQALPFYEKCGYEVFSRLPDFPPGGARYALTKNLDKQLIDAG